MFYNVHRSGNFFRREGGSLKACSDTLKYAKIWCRKTTSTEAAEVARGEDGTKCDLWYLFYNVHRLGNFFFEGGGVGGSLKVCSDTLKYAKIGCRKTTSAEAAEVARGEDGTKCDLWYLFYNVHRLGNFFFEGGGVGGSLKVCSDTLKYAKIGCRKTTSAEAAEVARGEGGTKCNLWYLFYNVHRSGNFFRREGGLSKHAQIH